MIKYRSVKIILIILVIILVYILSAVLPYVKQPDITAHTIQNTDINNFYGDASVCDERVKIIADNGEALSERIRLIAHAKKEIILSTFDFDTDNSGKMLLAALLDAANRNVNIKLIIDGMAYSSGILGNPWFMALTEMDNVQLKVYNPINPLKPWTAMGRMHDKYLIADRTAYILGGRNCFDYFLGDHNGYKNYDWDFLVYCAESKSPDSLNQLIDYFNAIWEQKDCRLSGKKRIFKKHNSVSESRTELKKIYDNMLTEHPEWFSDIDYKKITTSADKITLISNPTGIYPKEPIVFYTITELMKNARQSVSFHTPYILCNDWMTERLTEICKKVPEVRMMTNSIANNGNPFGAMDYRANKSKLLDTGIQILEYDGGVSYHGKCFIIDNRLSAIGSFNWDMRSAYLDTELMLVIDSITVASILQSEMNVYEKDALKVTGPDSYDLAEGQTPQVISKRRKFLIEFISHTIYWARFLM